MVINVIIIIILSSNLFYLCITGVPQRPHVPLSYTDMQTELHVKSETEDSYEEDVNKSMRDLVIEKVSPRKRCVSVFMCMKCFI